MVGSSTQTLKRYPDAKDDVKTWVAVLSEGCAEDEVQVIQRACEMVRRAHAHRLRPSGESYLHHGFSVAQILAGLAMDHETLAAALLHEVVDQAEVTLKEVKTAFGAVIARLVDGVTRITGIAGRRQDVEVPEPHQQAEDLRKLLLAVVEDVRVVLIKLADCLDNVRRLRLFPEPKARQIAMDTRDIYAPLANRLGIWQIKWELEDLVFRYLEPEIYQQLAELLDERRADREAYIADVIGTLRAELEKAGIEAEITGRPKHIYSIWRKMQKKGLDFHQLFDLRAVRILVRDIPACYGALGVVHSLWPYIPGEFDDYIATPKGNLYQSLHTAVVGPQGQALEVQIRSHDMHQDAELGVAAHWRYKEGARYDASIEKRIAWLRKLVESRDALADIGEFVDQLKTETTHDRVYVFTPRGKIIDLPQGATSLDFAYAIHTEVGHRCRGAKVDGQIVPLPSVLKSGETVEVLQAREAVPSRNWLSPHLGYLKTSRARAKVRHWFNQRDHGKNVASGRSIVDRELHRLGIRDYDQQGLVQRFRFKSFDDLLAALGRGEVSSAQIAAALEGQLFPRPERSAEIQKPRALSQGRAQDAIHIDGVGNLLVHRARCCKPVPHESVIGYITRGRGVTIHQRDCTTVLHLADDDRERLIEVTWTHRADVCYPVDIQIKAYDRQGLLQDVTAVLTQERVTVIAATPLSNKRRHTAALSLTLEVTDAAQLSRMLGKIGQLPNVIEVRRQA